LEVIKIAKKLNYKLIIIILHLKFIKKGEYTSYSDFGNRAVIQLLEIHRAGGNVQDLIRKELESDEVEKILRAKVRTILAELVNSEFFLIDFKYNNIIKTNCLSSMDRSGRR